MHVRCRTQLALVAALVSMLSAGCSRSAQDYVARGDAQLKQGNEAAAVLEYRNAVQKDPRLAPARHKLAEIYLRQGNASAALAEYVRAADLLPNDANAQLRAGTLLGLARRFEEARARAEKVLAIDPKNVNAIVLRANALAGLTDLEGAVEQMQLAVSLDPQAGIQTNLGAIQAARGHLPEAEAAFRQAVATDPKSVTAHVALGRFLWSAGKRADAEDALKAAVALGPADALANQWMAAFYVQSGRAPEAEAHLKKIMEVANTADTKLALADYYRGMRRATEAIDVLEKLSAEPRSWALAKSKIAEIQFAEGKKDDAFRTASDVIAKEPSLAQAYVVRGQLLLADDRVDEALRDGQAAVKLEGRNAAAHFLLGKVHDARHDLDAAAAAYSEVLKLNPRASNAQVQLAVVEMQRNSLPAATQLAEQASAMDPGKLNVSAQLVVARSLLLRGDLARAAAVTQALEKQAAGIPAVQTQVGMLALAKGDRAAARVAFEKALASKAPLMEPLTALVALDVGEGKPAAARARVEERLKQTPANSLVLALAGRTWASTGDMAKGEQFLKRAIEADSSNFDAYGDLARLYLAQNKMDAAIAEFDKAAARRPRDAGPATMAALILQTQGKEAEARRRYERLVEVDPRAAVASNNLAYFYARDNQQLDRALQLAQAAKAQVPDHPEVNDTLGFVYLKKQLPMLAIPPLKIAIEKNPRNPSFHYHLGLAYSQIGDKASARLSLEKALNINADFAGADEARKVLGTLE